MRVNWRRRELHVKIVYYGPPMAGKTTNLEQLQRMIAPQHRSELLSLDTEGDRTLFFDLMQVSLGKVGGLAPRISLYTVPGQVRYQHLRSMVLRGADGVVFVADSDANRLEENRALWQQMLRHLASHGLQDIPIVVQANKRDLPNALALDELREALHLPEEIPMFPAQASRGLGVRETFMAIVRFVLLQPSSKLTASPSSR